VISESEVEQAKATIRSGLDEELKLINNFVPKVSLSRNFFSK
jgi:hypothetical protein